MPRMDAGRSTRCRTGVSFGGEACCHPRPMARFSEPVIGSAAQTRLNSQSWDFAVIPVGPDERQVLAGADLQMLADAEVRMRSSP